MPNRQVRWLFVLFTLSGFTGLIYESVWSHYLRLFLGAAAFAQSFVLMAFMGGLALGAWLASRASAAMRNPLLAYACIEALIGVLALVFHEAYVMLTGVSLQSVIPALGSPGAVELYKYTLCALLIVPQTILLGMTFPLLSTAVLRIEPAASGHHLSMLYFTNSLGAAIGALAAAFWLLGWLGMPGTMRLAGAANLVVAAIVLGMTRAQPAPRADTRTDASAPQRVFVWLFLFAAFLTGAASFVYELVWIRMLNLVLGSSFQAFELMLSAFITGLALGGLWIRRRIDSIADPLRFASAVQLLMGLAALATVFVFHATFDWMAWALGVLQRNAASYPLFNLFSHAIAFAVMVPVTFLAGMTLPLFTNALLRTGSGERAIGQIYAANTLGAIAGVLLALHLLIPGMGLKLALIVGAALDLILGAWLLRYSNAPRRRVHALTAVALGMSAAAATALAPELQAERLASGVFRYGIAVPQNRPVVFYRDGKTASVAVRTDGSILSIITNGKPDASIQLKPDARPTGDEYTMTILAALPLLVRPQASTYANIGFGSGLTSEVLLSHSAPREIDTIEIEPAMVAGARLFYPRVARPYRDPRSHIYLEDAKSYFARFGKRYDVIVSEPSNPWVNGVAGLFTTEFYRDAKRYLAPGGVFVQWLQLYELDDRLLASMLRALGEQFSDYEVYQTNSSDIVVLAVAEGEVPRPRALPASEKALLGQLDRIGIHSIEQITARSLGTKAALAQLLEPLGAPVNSDFHPYVQIEAPRARYLGSLATGILGLSSAPVPILEMAAHSSRAYLRAPAFEADGPYAIHAQSIALELARGLDDRTMDPLAAKDEDARFALLVLKSPGALCAPQPAKFVLDRLQWTAELTLVQLPADLRRQLWIDRKWLACPPGRMAAALQKRLDVYAAIATRDAGLMLQRAAASLGQETDDDERRFLLLTALLGARASGASEQARNLWKTYGGALFPGDTPPPFLLYLLTTDAR
jgi:predicted membrane-bound spermidine synthase